MTILQGWDDNSRLVLQRDDNGNETRYAYDALNRLERETFADGTTIRFFFDRDHNVEQTIDENQSIIDCAFDAANRLTNCRITRGAGVAGSTLQTFEYDGLYRNTLATDDNDPDDPLDDSVVERRFDSLSRILEEVQNGKVIASDWFADDLRAGLHYPNGRGDSLHLRRPGSRQDDCRQP